MKRLVVVGAGAVGGCIGGLLHPSALEVLLVARGEHGRSIREQGLSLGLPGGYQRLRVPCVESVEQVDWREGDVALLATKLNDARQALDALLDAAGSGIPVVCACNGIHGDAWAAERFEQVLSMLVWMPATHLRPGEVRLHAAGSLGVLDTGAFQGEGASDSAESLCESLRAVGFDAVARADIMNWKHAKWISNIGGTAQALLGEDWLAVAAAARAEAEQVLEAAAVPRVPTEELMQRVSAVLPAEVDGEPRAGGSTWQSQKRGKPLETPWLEGAIAALGKQVGVPTPVNTRLARAAHPPAPNRGVRPPCGS